MIDLAVVDAIAARDIDIVGRRTSWSCPSDAGAVVLGLFGHVVGRTTWQQVAAGAQNPVAW